jgi:hypothetical protein
MIATTPWEWDDDLALLEVIDLSEECRTPSRDHDLSIDEDRSECVSIYPVIDRDMMEVLEFGSEILIEETEDNDPLDVHLFTVLQYRAEYISRSLTPTYHEDVMLLGLPELEWLGRQEDIRIHDLPTVVALLVIEISTSPLESEVYPLCNTPEEDITPPWYRV